MSGKIALDTSIVVPYLKHDLSVVSKLRDSEEILIPFIVVGELFFGAYNSRQVQQNVIRIEEFCRDNVILPYSNEVAIEYGKIKTELKEKGRPIPENDIWIAAITRYFQIALATKDDHFSYISGLVLEKW